MTSPYAASYRKIGPTTLAVWESEFRKVASPLLPYVSAMHTAAGPHSALCLAQMYAENRYATTGYIIKPWDNNPLSLRPWAQDPEEVAGVIGVITAPDGGRFLKFLHPDYCVKEWRRRLFDRPEYKSGIYTKAITLKQLIDIYAPPGDIHPVTGVDNADSGYFESVMAKLKQFMNQEEEEPLMTTPTIYNLTNNADAQHFGLSPSERDKFMTGCFRNRDGANPWAIFCHVQEGSTRSSLRWAIEKPGGQNSYSATAQLDGTLLMCIPEQHGPWTNGAVRNPKPTAKKLINLGGNPNIYTLSIEAEGFYNKDHPQVQLDAIFWLVRHWQAKYGIADDWVFEHADVDSVQRANCAGPYYDKIRAMMKGGTVPIDPVVPHLAAQLFGEADGFSFDPKGPVSQLWLATGQTTGRYPRLIDVFTSATTKHFVFSSGDVIIAESGKPVAYLAKIAA